MKKLLIIILLAGYSLSLSASPCTTVDADPSGTFVGPPVPATLGAGSGTCLASSGGQQSILVKLAIVIKQMADNYKKIANTTSAVQALRNFAEKDDAIAYLSEQGEAIGSIESSFADMERTTRNFKADPFGLQTIAGDIRHYQKMLKSAEGNNDQHAIHMYRKILRKLKTTEWLKKANKAATDKSRKGVNQVDATKIIAQTLLRQEQRELSKKQSVDQTAQQQRNQLKSAVDNIGFGKK